MALDIKGAEARAMCEFCFVKCLMMLQQIVSLSGHSTRVDGAEVDPGSSFCLTVAWLTQKCRLLDGKVRELAQSAKGLLSSRYIEHIEKGFTQARAFKSGCTGFERSRLAVPLC